MTDETKIKFKIEGVYRSPSLDKVMADVAIDDFVVRDLMRDFLREVVESKLKEYKYESLISSDIKRRVEVAVRTAMNDHGTEKHIRDAIYAEIVRSANHAVASRYEVRVSVTLVEKDQPNA